jgi:hypothetical protein
VIVSATKPLLLATIVSIKEETICINIGVSARGKKVSGMIPFVINWPSGSNKLTQFAEKRADESIDALDRKLLQIFTAGS